jgi:hypothetical protein
MEPINPTLTAPHRPSAVATNAQAMLMDRLLAPTTRHQDSLLPST